MGKMMITLNILIPFAMKTKVLKFKCIFLFGIFLVFKASAQKEELFFINGQYYDTNQKLSFFMMPPRSSGMVDEQIDRYYSSCLYKLDNNTLATIDTLAHFQPYDYRNNEFLMTIRLYQDKNIAIVYTSKYSDEKDTIILREINFNEPYKKNIYKFWESRLYRYWMISKDGNLYFVDENVSKDSSWLTQRKFGSDQVTYTPYNILNSYISDGYDGLGCDDLYGGWGTKTEELRLERKLIGSRNVFKIMYTNGEITLPIPDEAIKLDTAFFSTSSTHRPFSLTISNNSISILF